MKLISFINYLFLIIILIIQSVTVFSSTDLSNIKPQNVWDMPALTLKGIDNKTHQIKDWKGKVILLTFWASWCSPCLNEINDFIKFQKHFNDKNLQIISIGLDNENNLKKISREMNINYPVLIVNIEQKSGKELLKKWGNADAFIPYSVIINSQGNIHYKHKGKLNTGLFDFYVRPLLNR